MATIYRAHDEQLGRDVAVKVMRSEYGRDPAFVARFRQEAQSAAILNHPNVVAVYDYGMESGDPFIVMELVDGGDLALLISEQGFLQPLPAAKIAQQMYEALDAAHARGIINRDVKPTNVLLTAARRVKVADFGIARAFSEAQLTMPGTTLGSVHYFSPEQARGEVVTPASDVYSAGLVLFEMLTGRRAWTGDSAGAVAVARLTGDPPDPSSVRQGIPHVLDIAVRRALARVPGDRPTAAEMAALLGRFVVDPQGAADEVAAPGGFAAGVGTLAAVSTAGARGGATRGPNAHAIPIPTRPPTGAVDPRFGAAGASGGINGPGGPGGSGGPPLSPVAGVRGAEGPAYGTIRGGAPPRRGYADEQQPEEETAGTWGWIAAVIGVLVLFAGGLLLFLLLSGRGAAPPAASGRPMVTVPSFVGFTLDVAEREAGEIGLVLSIGAYQQNDEVPENTVIAQDPLAGGSVLPGSRITVTVATRSVTVTVPEARLRTEPELFSILAQNELLPGTRSAAFDAEVPASLVIRTNPRAGIEVARGTPIDYVVSLGFPPTATPSLQPTLTPPITPTQPPTPTPPPTTSTPTATPTDPPPPPPTPPPTPTPTDTPSPPPPPTPVPTEPPTVPPTEPPTIPPETPTPFVCPTPDPFGSPPPDDPCVIVGLYATCGSLGEAKTQIIEAGLQVGTIYPSPEGEPADDWLVETQYPESGSRVPPGTYVDLLVKSPTDQCVATG